MGCRFFKSSFLIVLLVVCSLPFVVLEARPIHSKEEIKMFFDGLYIKEIETGGPSREGRGQGSLMLIPVQ